ncbi:MAG: pyruvate formate-lyase-activating protein [Firmicutes bacterium]|nr:pyruvate formate-lyase-activating protein [Bacillota bacterium]
MIKTRLHSIETFGAVDGPGIRTIFFLQGCPARCIYCHNPDTWKAGGGESDITPEEVLQVASRSVNYYGSEGGVTFSGGEPLIHGEFVLATMRLLKENGIKSLVDTSGTYYDEYTKDIFKECQVVLLDIKHSNPEKFHDICKCDFDKLLKVMDIANEVNAPVWVRQVIVPGINDTEENVIDLANFIKSHINNVYKAELLGYHTLALDKYKKLEMTYPLDGVKAMDKERLKELDVILQENLK